MIERLERGMSFDINSEHLVSPPVENFKADGIGAFKPEERDLDPVADSMGQLSAHAMFECGHTVSFAVWGKAGAAGHCWAARRPVWLMPWPMRAWGPGAPGPSRGPR